MNDDLMVDLYEDDEDLMTSYEEKEEEKSEDKEPMEIELVGVILEDELHYILSLIKRYESDSDIPLYLVIDNQRQLIGRIGLSYNLFLRLYEISPKYTLRLIDNLNGKSKILIGKDKKSDYKTLVSMMDL